MRRIFITYEVVTPESAEHGDAAERGYVGPGGYTHPIPEGLVGEEFAKWREDIEPVWTDEDLTAGEVVEDAARFLRREGYSEPSSHPHCVGDWFSWADSQPDYRTGEDLMQSAHLEGFTPEEERAIYELIHR